MPEVVTLTQGRVWWTSEILPKRRGVARVGLLYPLGQILRLQPQDDRLVGPSSACRVVGVSLAGVPANG